METPGGLHRLLPQSSRRWAPLQVGSNSDETGHPSMPLTERVVRMEGAADTFFRYEGVSVLD